MVSKWAERVGDAREASEDLTASERRPGAADPDLTAPVATPVPDHLTDPVDPVPLFNIANILTMLRIVLVPVFVILLFVGGGEQIGWRIAAAVVFAIAAITDWYDGRLARDRGLITDFGKLADPIADKALIGAALIALSVLGELPWWITIVILFRELWVTGLRFWVLQHVVMPASRGGKLKTMLQSIGIGLLLLPLAGVWQTGAMWLMYAAVAVTVYTGIEYTWQALSVRRKSRSSDQGAS